MLRKPVLHIGLPKTGTTALQTYCLTEEFFAPLGRFGPGGDLCASDVMTELLWQGLFRDDLGYRVYKDQYRFEVERLLDRAGAKDKIPILSQEAITIPSFYGSDYPAVFERLSALVTDPTILIFIRNQKSILRSFYNTLVSDMGASISFQDFILINKNMPIHRLNIARCLNYRHILDTLRTFFKDIKIVVFEDFIENPVVTLNQVFSTYGVEFGGTLGRANESREPDSIAHARALNRRFPRGIGASIDSVTYDRNHPVFLAIKSKVDKVIELKEDPKNYLSKQEVSIFNQVIGSSRQQQLTMYNKEQLIDLMKVLRISPCQQENYDVDDNWIRTLFGESNEHINAEYGLGLERYHYSLG